MDRNTLEKVGRINTIAASDDDYCKMERDWKRFEKDFEAYVDPLPKKIRNFLWGYAHMGIMMGNRKLILACEDMEFAAEKNTPGRMTGGVSWFLELNYLAAPAT